MGPSENGLRLANRLSPSGVTRRSLLTRPQPFDEAQPAAHGIREAVSGQRERAAEIIACIERPEAGGEWTLFSL